MTDKKPKLKIRRLFADIETSPNVGLFFKSGFGLNINPDAILQERKIICIGYKWEGERHTTVIRWDKNQDDRAMLEQFSKAAEQADEIVGHYGDHFDWPWIRTRILIHHLPAIPIYKTVDTKKLASKYFYFNSNKLDYISNVLGHGKKMHTDFSLWKRVLWDKCPKALNYMCKYCGRDVTRLECVFKDMQPFIKSASHAGVMGGRDKWSCPHDGSVNVHISKIRTTSHGTVQYQMQCQDCGAYYTISSKSHSDYLEYRKNHPKNE